MSNKIYLIFIFLVSFVFLNSCTDIKKGIGLEKETLNEFLIEKKDPLTLPPDYKLLPPDSTTKAKEVKNSNNSLKSIIDKNLGVAEKNNQPSTKDSSTIENEILNKIK